MAIRGRIDTWKLLQGAASLETSLGSLLEDSFAGEEREEVGRGYAVSRTRPLLGQSHWNVTL